MLNTIEAYEEQGRMAATARNKRDEGSASAAADHFRRMQRLEKEGDYQAATAAYNRGYAAARNVPSVAYYR
ncbi:hypothetical protein [Pseudomonas sp.]|mgnify:CR=1 FL=1|uniref:hypothetical protein n=1 Tax=Pseudomonas sp. TaxID=306 RepID=UPI003FD87EB4